jgi:glutathione S-transferase
MIQPGLDDSGLKEAAMKLYYSPGACSLAPHIVAREAGLPVELDKVDLSTRTTASGSSFTTINPKGYVPALGLQSGEVMTEVSALVQYLADQAPSSGLMPSAGTPERYRVLELIGFISTEIHKGFGPLWNPTNPEAVKHAALERLGLRFKYLDQKLAGSTYLTGDTFTVADAYAFTVVSWAKIHNIDLSPYPNLVAFMGRVWARPKVREALAAEGLIQAAA